MHTSDRRLYLDGDGNVVEADDPRREKLLVGKGGQIPEADARRYGLIGKAAQKAADEGEEAAQKPAEPTEQRDTALEIARPESAPRGGQKKA